MTAAAALAAAVLNVAACGDDKPKVNDRATPAGNAPAPVATTATTAGDSRSIQGLQISKDLERKPEIPKPAGDPPTELYTRDVVKGTGKTAKAGDTVSVQYVGASFSTGEQFDSSWDRNEPFQFKLGTQMVIAGWDEGVAGMRTGGRRLLVIPPDLGYGDRAAGSIAPNETLIFVVDLEKVE